MSCTELENMATTPIGCSVSMSGKM